MLKVADPPAEVTLVKFPSICAACTTFSVIGLAAAVALLPSALKGQGNPKESGSQAPRLIEIVPARGPAGPAYPLHATLHGAGFMPTGNVVEFGPARITNLPSPSGTEITFGIPKTLPSHSEVPPMVLPPGGYGVRVTTPAGTSNALTFTLTTGP